MGAQARWPRDLGSLLSFLYTPERWARAHEIRWSSSLENRRRALLMWFYRSAQVPILAKDGSQRIARVKPIYTRDSSWVRELLDRMDRERMQAARENLTDVLPSIVTARSPDVIEGWRFLVSGNPWETPLVLEGDPPGVRRAMTRVHGEAVLASRRQWRVCPLCGRVFPASRTTRACAPCRRRWTRRQVQWRLAGAPKSPVMLRLYLREASLETRTAHLPDGPKRVQMIWTPVYVLVLAEELRPPRVLQRVAQIARVRVSSHGKSASVVQVRKQPQEVQKSHQEVIDDGSVHQKAHAHPSRTRIRRGV